MTHPRPIQINVLGVIGRGLYDPNALARDSSDTKRDQIKSKHWDFVASNYQMNETV